MTGHACDRKEPMRGYSVLMWQSTGTDLSACPVGSIQAQQDQIQRYVFYKQDV